METTTHVFASGHQLVSRSGASTGADRPPIFKAVGITLAIASGVFIGISFVLKKMGLLKANTKYQEEAGEGYGYLKNAWWWSGMTLMIIGEICNFVAYAFVDAILVTPLGALSVVITTILSAIFLKERLSFVGKVGCFNCIIGSVVIVMNAPAQSAVADIQGMKDFVIAPGFLTYTGVVVLGCAFIAFWAGPRYGKRSMLVYISVCSLIGGLSVVCTQGLGAAIIAQISGKPQFNQWFLYIVLVFVIATLLIEIVYLNKALNLFNAALVTPTYYVFFTSATIVTSAILFRGFKGTPTGIATVIMGFLQICAGVVLLQMSKSAKDVPDAAVFKGDLDQVREIAEQEQPETEPKADAIRGTAAILRRLSGSRKRMEEEEARRYREEKLRDELEPLAENEIVEWDGIRRRKTVVAGDLASPIARRKTVHPPLGMSRFPDEDELQQNQAHNDDHHHGFLDTLRTRASSVLRTHQPQRSTPQPVDGHWDPRTDPVALTAIKLHPGESETSVHSEGQVEHPEHVYGLPRGLQKPQDHEKIAPYSPRSKPLPAQPAAQSPGGRFHISPPSPLGKSNRRQFSFHNMFRGPRSPAPDEHRSASNLSPPPSRSGIGSRSGGSEQKRAMKNATEEERLGLVKGDSHAALLDPDPFSERDPNPYASPLRPPPHELQYPYAATSQDSIASSPEAQTPVVPKHLYPPSASTMSDTAPLYKDVRPDDYFGSGLGSGNPSPAPAPPLPKEAEVDDKWQIPTPQELRPPSTPTPQPSLPTNIGTSSPPPPIPPTHQQSQQPPYRGNDPYRPRQQRPPELAGAGAAAATEFNPFQATTTSQYQTTTGNTTTREAHTRSNSPIRGTRDRIRNQNPPTRREERQTRREEPVFQNQNQAAVGIRVIDSDEQEYEARSRQFANRQQHLQQQQQQQQQRNGRRSSPPSREGDKRGGASAHGPASGAFL